jgi:hypothetical protein
MHDIKPLSAPAILLNYKPYDPETVDIPPIEAATLLNLSVRTLEKYRPKRKYLDFTKSPGGITYKLSDVLALKQSFEVKSVEAA